MPMLILAPMLITLLHHYAHGIAASDRYSTRRERNPLVATDRAPALGIDRLAAMVVSAQHGDVPSGVRDRARTRILDALGCAALGSTNRLAGRALSLAGRLDEGGPVSHWFARTRGSLHNAAFINSVLTHNVANDDVGAGGHPGSNVVPAAIAVAEAEGSSGEELVTAVVLGYEVQSRIGRPSFMAEMKTSGLRNTTIFGAFGAATVAARLLRLSTSQTASALAYAASLAVPGLEEPLRRSETDERSIQTGINTSTGILSALIAQIGLTGSPWALAGECGLFGAYGDAPGLPTGVLDALGERWCDQEVFAKPYPGGYATGIIQCATRIVRECGVDVDDIDQVSARMPYWGTNTGYINPGPHLTLEQATMSAVFGVAAAFVYGTYGVKVMRSAFDDPRVRDFVHRVQLEGVRGWGVYQGEVSITLKDGRTITEVADVPASMTRPSWQDAAQKFHSFADSVLDVQERDRLVDLVAHLDKSPDISGLIAILSRAPTPDGARTL